MLLLVLFALLAGAATALSPCVLPVLPVALAGGATGGRRRPMGIALGLTVSFTFAAVALVYVIDALGLPDDLVRTVAIATLVGFGIVLAVPSLAARVEAPLSRLSGRVPVRAQGEGFGSGLVLGLGLGIVYAPCAGPILAGVVTASATQPLTAQRVLVAAAYAIGSGLVIYALLLGGRRVTRPLARRAGTFQLATGAVMVLLGVAMLGDLDLRFQSALADHLPASIVTPTAGLERGADGEIAALTSIGGGPGFAANPARAQGGDELPVLGEAPGFRGGTRWFNTRDGRELTMDGLRGRVVLVDVWAYSCINCLRTLPYLRAWHDRYASAGLTIVGVHAPEFAFERSADNVAGALRREDIGWPVVQDNDRAIWNAWGNQYWPTEYLVDARGRVRAVEIGEGDYEERERAIRSLLEEAGADLSGDELSRPPAEQPGGPLITPESYLGAARAQSFDGDGVVRGAHDYPALPGVSLPVNHLRYAGRWNVGDEQALAGTGAALQLGFRARRVFLVLSSPGRPRRVRLELDGRPLPARFAGGDVEDGEVTVREDRLYRLVELPDTRDGTLTLRPEPGVRGYAFTFG